MTPLYQRLFVFTILYILIFSSVTYSQKAVELSHNGRKVIIRIGKRVKYTLKDGFQDAGRIQSIDGNALIINDKNIKLNEFSRIGKKGHGSNFFGIFFTALGGLTLIAIAENASDQNDPCPSCQNTTTTSDPIGPAVIGCLIFSGVGIAILASNAQKNLSDNWTMKTIDLPKKK